MAKPSNGTSHIDALTDKVGTLSTDTKDTPQDAPEDAAPVTKKHENLADANEVQVEVTLADNAEWSADHPLYKGAKTFEDLSLSANLLKGIYSMGFERPSKIQERALPLLLMDPPRNMIGQSQSGTGKTAAFTLAMLSRVQPEINAVQAICLAPARELARQIMDVVKTMGKFTDIKMAYAIRDSNARNEALNAHILIGTPGTMMDLLRKKAIDPSKVKLFVLDEADNMLDQQGLGDQSIRIKKMMPPNCQIVLFSATFNDQLRNFADRFAPNANKIALKQEELSVEGIKQFYMDCKNEAHKVEVLVGLYGLLTIGQSIIFVRRRDTADALGGKMHQEGHSVFVLHGKLEAQDRDKVIDDFRQGKFKVLITTNVLARGIDILQVNLVINFDLPLDQSNQPDFETYLHRIGRTGRFGRTGASINFVHNEQSYKEMKKIESYFGKAIVRVPTDNWQEVEQVLKKAVK